MAAIRTGAGTTRRWGPLVAIAAGVLLAAVIAVVVFFALRPAPTPLTATPVPSPAPTAEASSPPTVNGSATVLADGCLGGTDPIKAIRIAHAKAPLTPEGAAEFVATMARWLGQAPKSSAEFQQTGQLIWAPALPASNRQMPVSQPGSTSWLSTKDARYRIAKAKGDDVTVEFVFTQTIDKNGEQTQVEQVGQFTVTKVDGHWAFKAATSAGQAPAQVVSQLRAEGLPYSGGC